MSSSTSQSPTSPASSLSATSAESAPSSLWLDAWHRLRKNKLSLAGGTFLIVITLACFLGPSLSAYGFEEMNLDRTFEAPSADHWLGTDQIGRDLLTRLLKGGQISLLVGFIATAVALTIGVTYGAIAGYIGGKLDNLMMRIVDIIYALPFTILVILLMVFLKDPSQAFDTWLSQNFGWLGPTQGMGNILLMFAAIGAVEWLTMARIVRSQVMAVKKMEYIEAARSLGYGNRRILFRHILPNILGPVIVYTTLTIPAVMLLEAFLSFLGLGVQAPLSTRGSLIKDGTEKMEEYSWLLIYPATIFSLTLFSLNFLGDGLRDALDVKASKD